MALLRGGKNGRRKRCSVKTSTMLTILTLIGLLQTPLIIYDPMSYQGQDDLSAILPAAHIGLKSFVFVIANFHLCAYSFSYSLFHFLRLYCMSGILMTSECL
uniref:Uncharacterized protein n=1 Tax=Spongospora subterranea TaxID=70186 RepID=A0A0H5QJK6_9EUKA|eukprot:CRZ01511.1 hypothetical protein [Spongospora subterranea]